MRPPVALASLALALSVPGCSQGHLTSGFGRAQRAAFQAQAVRPAEKARPPTMALDTQEADVVSRAYVKGLAGKEDRQAPEPILLVAPQRQGQQGMKIAPSVPKE